ncbi:MAG: hypothetical protein RMJ98_11860 [Myxococcales bacterium]|nr:hypothetical protein [Polyangiaceae bacterium]MDW8249983.1 hypothetical protein [Myxococcales bacterium]
MDATVLRRRIASSLLLVGVALLAGTLLREAPRDHEIEVSFMGPRERLTWAELRLLGSNGEEAAGARWSWPPGQAPASVRSRFPATPGRWHLQIHLENGGKFRQIQRNVSLQGEPIHVPIQVEEGGG